MSWTFTVGAPPASSPGHPRSAYGWAHLHTLHAMLAAEEGIDLSSMRDFGGTGSWEQVTGPLRLLFDLGHVNGDHPTSAYPAVAARLRSIHARWSTTGPADDRVPPSMRAGQLRSLASTIAVIEACIATGRRLRVS